MRIIITFVSDCLKNAYINFSCKSELDSFLKFLRHVTETFSKRFFHSALI
nr:MAG TPA: hypothetical protein [Caudoviricetes sp.]